MSFQDLTKTSDKNAFIFKQMYDKYILREDKYNQFKTCLRKIDLGFLVDELEKSEDVIICKYFIYCLIIYVSGIGVILVQLCMVVVILNYSLNDST
jgi:hypothetical protein